MIRFTPMAGQAFSSALMFLSFVLTPSAFAQPVRLAGEVKIAATDPTPAVRLALQDLARDLESVLGQRATLINADKGDIFALTAGEGAPESFLISISEKGIRISAPDQLGLIYGIYAFSHQCLGVDPYWFWKDIKPRPQKQLLLDPRIIQSRPAQFRYRGWFINDEDLLTEFKPPSGQRHIDYPFYSTVINLDLADRIFETLLRAGGNLIIPASFVDVMNDPEAELVRRAAQRGLYVTQHHIEPMGMSHFGFENYWKSRGQKIPFAYGKDPTKVHETWRAYAKKWREIAGDHVIWQIGLRGRGDRSLWSSDKTVTAADAGKIISAAMTEQVKIIRETDPRPDAQITTTLWLEMSNLMNAGSLRIPSGVSIVFCDEGLTQTLQNDFETTPRENGRQFGLYYHVGFWKNGPHLLMGTRPEKLASQFARTIARNDTHYAIINVTNIREHLLGIEAAMTIMRTREPFDRAAFMARFAPPKLADGYDLYLAALAEAPGNILIQDGHTYSIGEALLTQFSKGQPAKPIFFPTRQSAQDTLTNSITKLDALIETFDTRTKDLDDTTAHFHRRNLLAQSKQLRGQYAWLIALMNNDKPAAIAALESVLSTRAQTATNTWQNWYTGDKKANVPKLLEKTRAMK